MVEGLDLVPVEFYDQQFLEEFSGHVLEVQIEVFVVGGLEVGVGEHVFDADEGEVGVGVDVLDQMGDVLPHLHEAADQDLAAGLIVHFVLAHRVLPFFDLAHELQTLSIVFQLLILERLVNVSLAEHTQK